MVQLNRILYWAALMTLCLLPILASALQTPDVTAEAYIEANLRSTTDINAPLVDTIYSGEVYPVIGRSEFFPWVLLADPTTGTPYGWVFQDLVIITGNLTNVPYSSLQINPGGTPTPTAIPTSTLAPVPATDIPLVGVAVGVLPTPTPAPGNQEPAPTATPTQPSGIVGQVTGEINIRFGPGIDYPRIGVGQAGDAFEITAYHTSVPWVQIRYDNVAGGFGWVALDLLAINGNIYTLPAISRTDFALPTLTPTPNTVLAASLPDGESPPLSPPFKALGDTLWNKMLDAGFEPETSRIGSLFLMDLQTGEAIALGDDIAYSGMSLSKINILATMYRNLDTLPDGEQARHLANMMICSENTSSNQILRYIGGDPYAGASEVTAMLQNLGLQDTFMVAPFLIDPRITPQPVRAPDTPAQQNRANPDPFNQMTISEMGWMLSSIYQCANDGTGPLINTYSDAFTQNECQSMVYLMQNNNIGALFEASVPPNTAVAHKHGWINDTHGDAGIMFTEGGDYVLVILLHNPTWLNFEESFPLIEDIALTVYNYYNPAQPLTAPRQSQVPEVCELANSEGARIMDNLMRGRTE